MRGSGGWRWREGTCEVGVGGCGVGASRWAGQGPLPLPPGWAGLGCACERRSGGAAECPRVCLCPRRGDRPARSTRFLGCGLRATACACQCLCSRWRDPGTVGVASPGTYTQVGSRLGSIQRVRHPSLGRDSSTSNHPHTPNSRPRGDRIINESHVNERYANSRGAPGPDRKPGAPPRGLPGTPRP